MIVRDRSDDAAAAPVVAGVGGLILPDDYEEQEHLRMEAQRTETIKRYGSLERYDEWVARDIRRMGRERRRAMVQIRIERARPARSTMPVARHDRVARPRQRRTAARRAAGIRTGTDPGDSDPDSEPAGVDAGEVQS